MVVHHIQWYCIVLHGIGLYFMAVYSIVTYIQKVKMFADFFQSKKSSKNINKFLKQNFATNHKNLIIFFTTKGKGLLTALCQNEPSTYNHRLTAETLAG